MVKPQLSIMFPRQFQGFFRRTQPHYAPLLEAARHDLVDLAVPLPAKPYYAYVVRDNPQPSFMLLPLMYLGVADAMGGITPAHRDYLPIIMLAMEICAVMDDTVDRTPMRSGRHTFAERFGDESATPFTALLVAIATEQTQARAPMLLELLTQLIAELGAGELWEIHQRYPAPALFETWLQNRYNQVTPAIVFALNSALYLSGAPQLPGEVAKAFARIFQDVDDIVNLVEMREQDGENDDLKLGMITRPLLVTFRAHPPFADELAAFWHTYAPLARLSRQTFPSRLRELDHAHAALTKRVRATVLAHGIAPTLRQIEADACLCIQASPVSLQPLMEELVLTFLDRLRGVADSLEQAA